MSEIKWSISPEDVEWEMEWASMKANPAFKDHERIQAHADTEMVFEDEAALAHLLVNQVVFLNSHWWEKEWPEDARKRTSINVNCNDVFAWGCADAESMLHDDIENLYRMWRKDPAWGAAVWCMIRRNQMPQKPVEKIIRAAGIWDLDALRLGDNTMEADVQAFMASLRAPSPQPSGDVGGSIDPA
jgi:hypothetical protein